MEGVLSLNSERFCTQRIVKVIIASLFLIALPIYLYFGMQPAASLDVSGYPTLEIASIDLSTPVAPIELKDHQLTAPDLIAGIYQQQANKQLIIGHSSTVFRDLENIKAGDVLSYDGQNYQVATSEIKAKSDISMNEILAATDADTIIIMTCAGEPLENQDATHRLIVTAIATE